MALFKSGSRGSGVGSLQSNLAKLGFKEVGKADNIFGRKTQTAVKNFQKKYGLKVDGLAGKNTLAKINSLITAQSKPKAAPAKPATVKPKTPAKPTGPRLENPNEGFFATGDVALPNQRVDLNTILQRSQQMLNPLINQQKQTATSTFSQELQKLNDQMASRGLLASGLAATQQRQGIEALASQLSGIEAQGQADALANAYDLGNFQENQRQFDMGFALEEGALTGKYLPAGARDLMNQLATQKQIIQNGSSTEQQRKIADRKANDIRRTLNTMGLATNNLGEKATLQDVLNSIGSGSVGSNTLQENQRIAENEQRGIENAQWQKRFNQDVTQFNREMTLQEQSEQFRRQMETRVQDFQEKQAQIDNDLAARGLNLEEARQKLDEMATMTDLDYQKFQMDMGISEEEARRATNGAVAEAMRFSDMEKAYEWLYMNANGFYEDGVDVSQVLSALDQRFGGNVGASPFPSNP